MYSGYGCSRFLRHIGSWYTLPSYGDCVYPEGGYSSLLRNIDSSIMIDAAGSSETSASVYNYTLSQIRRL
jgi:hypothetical protein